MAPAVFLAALLSLLRLPDFAAAMLLLFLSSAAVHWATAKGPMVWPVIGSLPSFLLHIHSLYDWVTDSAARSGGTFPYYGMWFSRSYGVITTEPANVEYILKTHFTNFPKGRYFRERFSDFFGDGIFNADDATWRLQRRVAAEEMHTSRFAHFSAETVKHLLHGKLLPLLHRMATGGASAFDLQDVFLRFTFDNICTAAFGFDPGCLAPDHLPEVPFSRAFEEATELTLFRFLVPPFVWKTMKMFNAGTERRLRLAIKIVHEFAEKMVRDRQADLALHEKSDLLSRLIDTCSDGERQFSEKFLKELCISFILAGRDTSSVALAWFFWLLYNHPHVERRILDEISEIINHKGATAGAAASKDEVFTVEEVNGMQYLQAALTESLRLYPSVPADFKEAAEDDVLPDGTAVKKGARVIYLIYSMGRMERIWGQDCREFKPERWMREGTGFVGESPFKYAVFNGGPRLCVGKKFANMQMKMVAAAMLLRFRVVVEEGQVVAPKLSTTLYMKNGLRVRLERRNWK